jgi:hypothetical protein
MWSIAITQQSICLIFRSREAQEIGPVKKSRLRDSSFDSIRSVETYNSMIIDCHEPIGICRKKRPGQSLEAEHVELRPPKNVKIDRFSHI